MAVNIHLPSNWMVRPRQTTYLITLPAMEDLTPTVTQRPDARVG
jgi:hypothetical protein